MPGYKAPVPEKDKVSEESKDEGTSEAPVIVFDTSNINETEGVSDISKIKDETGVVYDETAGQPKDDS